MNGHRGTVLGKETGNCFHEIFFPPSVDGKAEQEKEVLGIFAMRPKYFFYIRQAGFILFL